MAQCKLCGEYKPSDSFNWCEKCQDKVVHEAVSRSRKAGVMTFDELPQKIKDNYETWINEGITDEGMVISAYLAGVRAGQAGEPIHYAEMPFVAFCGADKANQKTAGLIDCVTCIECLRKMAEMAGRGMTPKTDAALATVVNAIRAGEYAKNQIIAALAKETK